MGISWTQGAHQVAQKFTSRGLPRKEASARGLPSGLGRVRLQSLPVAAASSGDRGAAGTAAGRLPRHRATPAPAATAAPATGASNQRRRLAGRPVEPAAISFMFILLQQGADGGQVAPGRAPLGIRLQRAAQVVMVVD